MHPIRCGEPERGESCTTSFTFDLGKTISCWPTNLMRICRFSRIYINGVLNAVLFVRTICYQTQVKAFSTTSATSWTKFFACLQSNNICLKTRRPWLRRFCCTVPSSLTSTTPAVRLFARIFCLSCKLLRFCGNIQAYKAWCTRREKGQAIRRSCDTGMRSAQSGDCVLPPAGARRYETNYRRIEGEHWAQRARVRR